MVLMNIDKSFNTIINTTMLHKLAALNTWQHLKIRRSRQNQNDFLIIKDKLKNGA